MVLVAVRSGTLHSELVNFLDGVLVGYDDAMLRMNM